MTSSVKMLGIGMAVMLLVLKPEIGFAIVNGVSVGVQGIADSFEKESDNEIVVVEDVVENNDATALILDQLLQEFKSLKDKSPQIIIEERESSLLSKHQAYNDALEKQYILEKKAIYHGNDPIVRHRLNLPPKLPSFEQWNPTAESFDKEFNAKFGSR
jgi:hypothetical protein